MKRIIYGMILTLSLLGVAGTQRALAQDGDSFAAGKYQFSLADGYTQFVEFEARGSSDGRASGYMMFSDEAEFTYIDVDGTGDWGESFKGFYVKVEFDGMAVNKNQAVMSGTVRDSSVRTFIGQRMLLTVEDNGDNSREPDKLTWGIYQPTRRDWIPSDAELKEDDGWRLTWVATDAERKEDEGVLIQRDVMIGHQTFELASYTYVDIDRGAGDILVRPASYRF